MALNNNVTLIGRLTKDLELKQTQQGLSVVNFALAVDKYKSEEADFINCQAWRQSAEYLNQYANKGTMIALNGRIATRNYDNDQGQKVYVTEVVADSVKILSSPNAKAESQTTQAQPTYTQQSMPVAGRRKSTSYANQGFYVDETQVEINSDDLPF